MHVHIVDDERELMASLTILLRQAGHQVHSFASGEAFLAVADDIPVGCVLLDLLLPEINGLEVQARLAEMKSSHAVVLLTGFGDVPDAVQAMKAGALDFLRKPFRRAELLEVLERAEAHVARTLAEHTKSQRLQTMDQLTDREREVLIALASGDPTKIVAHRMNLSARTVEMHRAHILRKLDVGNIAAALLMAERAGLIEA